MNLEPFVVDAILPMPPAELTQAISLASRCLCKLRRDDMPCWRCAPSAFSVYWFARFGEDPVKIHEIEGAHMAAGVFTEIPRVVTWRILCPQKCEAETLSIRRRFRTPERLSYRNPDRMWSAYTHIDRRESTNLRLVLLKYRKNEKLKRRR